MHESSAKSVRFERVERKVVTSVKAPDNQYVRRADTSALENQDTVMEEEKKISTIRTSVGEVKQQLFRERMDKGRSVMKETKIYVAKAPSTSTHSTKPLGQQMPLHIDPNVNADTRKHTIANSDVRNIERNADIAKKKRPSKR